MSSFCWKSAYAYYLDNAGSNEAALAALALQEAITPFKNAQQYGYKSDSSVTPEPEPDPELFEVTVVVLFAFVRYPPD